MSKSSGMEPVQSAAPVPPSSNKVFPSPFDLEAPEGAEGWEELYPYYCLIRPERKELEEGKFWCFDGMHNPGPLYPFDTSMTEYEMPPAFQGTVPNFQGTFEIQLTPKTCREHAKVRK